ncbi:MAG: hypothetical protein NZM44_00525 [Candidatus Calescibacterium sp.]|nr:hypothetical protein [Candidatus Calescibacterium sp.]MCX7758470.1 hypothetical protein [bacterium]
MITKGALIGATIKGIAGGIKGYMEAKQEYSKLPVSTLEVEVIRPQYRVEHGSIVITEVDTR